MMNPGKFQRPAAQGGPPAQQRSRYAGAKAQQPREPYPHAGIYRFRVLSCTEGHNPGKGTQSYKVQLEVVDLEDTNTNHAKGATVFASFRVGGNGSASGISRTKAFVMGAAGYEDEAEFDAFDPGGAFIDATCGAVNPYSQAGLGIMGRLVDCMVTRGNTRPDGIDYYREYSWAAVPEAEQTTPRPELQS